MELDKNTKPNVKYPLTFGLFDFSREHSTELVKGYYVQCATNFSAGLFQLKHVLR